MKSNVRCWTPPAAAPLIAMLWLTGCAMGGSESSGHSCPPVVEYSGGDQARAADEVDTLPEGTMIVRMLIDYAVLRDQARACRRSTVRAIHCWTSNTSEQPQDQRDGRNAVVQLLCLLFL